MLREEKPDVVVICTPPATHRALVIEALEHGAHVLVEKPMALTSADCREMVDASHRQNTNRAAGAMDQLDPVRQHCLDTVSEDGVRVASADFHDVYRFGTPLLNLRHERVDFLQQKLRFFGISEFVDVFHFVFFLYLKLSGHPIMANEPRLSASNV